MRLNPKDIHDMTIKTPGAYLYGDFIIMLREDYDQNNIDECKDILFDQISSTGLRINLDLSTIRFKTTHIDDYVVSSPFSAHQLIPVSIISWTAVGLPGDLEDVYDTFEDIDFDSAVLKHLGF